MDNPVWMKYQQQRHFGFILAGIFALVALWPVPSGNLPALAWLAAAAFTLALAMLAPYILTPFSHLWHTLGHVLGVINTHLLLAAVFFLLITPIGLIARMSGHDPLKLRRPQRSGYWQNRADEWHADSFKNQF